MTGRQVVGSAAAAKYEGRAQLGHDDRAIEVVVKIPVVEHPDWFGVIVDAAKLPRGEVDVTLLDDGFYNAWTGSAVLSASTDGRSRLIGHAPLVPPVGA